MRSKLAKRRAAQNRQKWAAATGKPEPVNIPTAPTAEPTRERRAKGKFAKGADGPAFDQHHDMVARLTSEKKLKPEQSDAARTFQELRHAYELELGVKGYRSCLDDTQGGFDNSDGNPAAKQAYEALRAGIGRIKTALLLTELPKGNDAQPRDLAALKAALDEVRRFC